MAADHPIRVVVEDDLRRSRLTVAFRLLLAIPHLVWFVLWSLVAFLLAIVNWLIALFRGRAPDSLHDFFTAYVRYSTHLYAYLLLAANPYPAFTGGPGYPVDVEIPDPERQRRWTIAVRLLLAVPALLISAVLLSTPAGGGGGGSGGGGGRGGGEDAWAFLFGSGGGLAFVVAFLAWFVCLVRGRMPRGFRDLLAYALRFNAQTAGYLFLLTERYPNSDPAEPRAPGTEGYPAEQPVRLTVDDDRRRSRLTVAFRLLLALPHLVWLALWTVAALVAGVANWLVTLVTGRSPRALHRFLSAYVRYTIHVAAFLFLVANPFPGFTGAAGRYPVDVEIEGPDGQHRLATLIRLLLAIPALLVSSGLGSLMFVAGVLGWFASLFTGRMPKGLRNAGAYALRYEAQTNAYLYVLTDRYPYSGPSLPAEEPAEPEATEGPDGPEPALAATA
ncbi:MAG: DUF4389 domain-containing protein [Actinomycetota bacterium]|nr:DUF4389 domain-containing protein [Actinomycetota bacterium]